MKVRGFTLMEMVVTLVIGSFIMLGIAGYVQLGMKGYKDTIERQRIQTQAQFVLEKMAREIRHAVPNSFHQPAGTTGCLEFVPIEYSGFYILTGNDIEFLIGNNSVPAPLPAQRWMVINPTRYEDLFPAAGETSAQRFDVGNLAKTGDSYLVSGGATAIGGTSKSVSNRHYIYAEGSAVRYCFAGSQVTRNGITVAEDIDSTKSAMHYLEPTLQRGGLVYLKLEFLQNGERSVYQQDVQVLNVP
ncbi:prepilin-type N-terminal cleavage/methylation domain-containing protein [Vibrio sp. CAU 1672]|uniref:PilW family protein n=1 Tax=Vibrio sp. CAU 1672 TaxID=3032594 RepID=UPI0023D9E289|nr:prepilin-type N-terminal cleavage/methylation domain-containing protein [Vibrio sp. CAU 1672]MDF2155633.1 prepilin-type N-terminal cleavage/methylation domain-containing protein [Vibrio sp. CAU 1672]